jgi:hypothetical protein
MINDLLADWKDRWKYVDDTTTTETICPDCNSNFQELVIYIDNWTTSNNMKLIIGKCKAIGIDFAKKISSLRVILDESPEKVCWSNCLLSHRFVARFYINFIAKMIVSMSDLYVMLLEKVLEENKALREQVTAIVNKDKTALKDLHKKIDCLKTTSKRARQTGPSTTRVLKMCRVCL